MNNSILKRAAKIAVALVLLINAVPGVSQAQRLISYQGIVTDANNVPVTGLHTMTLKIYTSDTGTTPVFQETQKVTFSAEGLFNVMIGSVKPLMPLSVTNPATDRYYLGVQIDISPELTPRSPFSDVPSAFFADTAGYARSAHFSDTAAFARAIDPKSLTVSPTTVNGISNAVIITGGGITTVGTNGDTIQISSTELPSVRGLQNFDGSLTINSPNGPYVTLGVADSGITSIYLASGSVTNAKLANGAVTNTKLSSGAVTSDKVASGAALPGFVLAADGAGGTIWQSATASALALPYAGTAASSAILFSITNTGSGGSGYFQINNGANAATAALQGTTNGLGSAGTFSITNNANSASALSTSTNGSGASLSATTTGTGGAGTFSITNNANSSSALSTSTNGSGASLSATTTGTGSAGVFAISNSLSAANALSSTTNGTGYAGLFQITSTTSSANALEATTGSTSGSASGVYGWASNASGGGYGVWGQAEGIGADAIVGLANNTSGAGVGVYGWSKGATGVGVYGQSDGTTSGTTGVLGVTTNTSTTSGTFAGVQGNCSVPSANGYGVFGQVLNSGPGRGVYGLTAGTGAGVWGQTSGTGNGVFGVTSSTGSGVFGQTSGTGNGVFGTSSNASGYGVQGQNTSASGVGVLGLVSSSNYAIEGNNLSTSGIGVLGLVSSAAYAVWGQNQGTGIAVYGQATSSTTTCTGVYGSGYWGVEGFTTFPGGFGVLGSASGSTGYGVFGTTGSTSGTGTGVYAFVGATAPTAIGTSNALIANYGGAGTSSTTGNNIAIFTAGSTREFRFANNGQAFTATGGAWNSGGADLAESFDVIGTKSEYEPGDVLVLSAEATYHVAKCSTPYSKCVAGVYATAPGVLLGYDGVNGDTTKTNASVPMGVIGVLPTKVSGENGPIEVGDLLVTSATPGCAMKGDIDKLHFGNILGKAMEPFNAKGTGVIKVLVGKY